MSSPTPLPHSLPPPAPTAQSPSTSTNHFSSGSPSAQQVWHFPGPSSKYHQRSLPSAHHTRTKSAYTPTAPVLSTERRAHRRTHTHKSSVTSLSPPSEYARSPLSRFSSFQVTMASHHNGPGPSTPAKPHRRSSSLQNSPFSDYFTDEARSVDSTVSSTETKALLVRMNKLQSQLMRDQSETGRQAIQVVGKKLDEIERDVNTLYSQTRTGEDSGVFTDEEEIDARHNLSANRAPPYLKDHGGDIAPPEPRTIEQFRAERDWFILRTQELLDGLRYTQAELSKRFAEVRQLNEEHNAQIEERETQLEKLRSENEGLRSDLGFEYSELLFLKLQMKSFEVDVDAMNEDADVSDMPETPESKARREKKNRILSEMDRWRSDWQDVSGRFKRRRSHYEVPAERRDSAAISNQASTSGRDVQWHLQTVKEGHGRVTSLTIKRMDSSPGPDLLGDASLSSSSSSSGTHDSGLGKSIDETSTISMSNSYNFDLDGSAHSIFATLGAEQNQAYCMSQQEDNDVTPRQQQQQKRPSSELPFASTCTFTRPKPSTTNRACTYVEHGTQTELPISQESQDDHEEEHTALFLFENQQNRFGYPENNDEEGGEGEGDDCAITTSSEASDDVFDERKEEEEMRAATANNNKSKTAWQELWASLQNFSGLGEDDDD